MVIKKSQNLDHSTLNVESSKALSRDTFTDRRHVPRSVCDTERDRRQQRDPLKEEELK